MPGGRVVVIFLTGTMSIAACGADSSSRCREVREPADPQSFTHVVDPGSVNYVTDPPTSGPHMAVPPPSGTLDAPLIGPLQVRVLESGGAMIQWEDVDAETIAELARLSGPRVVVAPGLELPDAIVATAWTWKLTCSELDTAALTEFIASRPAEAPGAD